jgi:DNA-binding NarL/FixJ family response regulator
MISGRNENEYVISVLVAESCAMSCELLATALERNGSGLSVVASATDASEIISSYAAAAPDICIVGANLKDGISSGFKATRELRSQSPEARIILLLDVEQPQTVVDAFRAGAVGVFSREEPFEVLCKSVQRVHQGQLWISNRQIQFLVDSLRDSPAAITDAKGTQLLTKREQGLVHLVAEGRTNKEISRELNLSEHTVRNYLFRIFNKLGTSNRLELALYAINHGQALRDSSEDRAS